MSQHDSGTTGESNINQGDRVRVCIPYPDGQSGGIYGRTSGEGITLSDHERFHGLRGTVVGVHPDAPLFTVKLDGGEEILGETRITLLRSDLRLLSSSGDDRDGGDEVAMADGGDCVAYRVKHSSLGTGAEIVHYGDLDAAIQHVKDAANRDGWKLIDGDEKKYPWAMRGGRTVVITDICIRDEYRGLPNGGDV